MVSITERNFIGWDGGINVEKFFYKRVSNEQNLIKNFMEKEAQRASLVYTVSEL